MPKTLKVALAGAGAFGLKHLDAIKAIESFGQRIDPGPGGVTRADMAGQPIMNNRETGRTIVVTEADHG